MTAAEITNQEPPVIESASASTACQTSPSKTPYLITGITLAVIMLIIAGIAALVVLGVDAYARSGGSITYDLYDELDDYGYGNGWDYYGHNGNDGSWHDYWDNSYDGLGDAGAVARADA